MLGRDSNKQFEAQTKAGAAVGVVFGLVFFAIGITVIAFVWGDDAFGGPPLVFRVFASLIAVCFVAMGGAVAYASARTFVSDRGSISSQSNTGNAPQRQAATANYVCPACGAPLAEGADVSPLGDVKCGHCGRWFNIHQA